MSVSTVHSMQTSGINLPPITNHRAVGPPQAPQSKPVSKGSAAISPGPPPPIPIRGEHPSHRILEEYQEDLEHLKQENAQLRFQKEIAERDRNNVAFENNSLLQKLENLENIFVGTPIDKADGNAGKPHIIGQEYQASKVFLSSYLTS